MKLKLFRRDPQSKDGIALLMVLGIMSVLLLLGVSFGLNMRIERLVASSYSADAMAKHLAWVGIARAMEHIDTDVTDYSPPWIATNSYGSTEAVDNLLANGATNFIPMSLVPYALDEAAAAKWVSPSPGNLTNAQYAYTILDMSQLVDIGGIDSAGGATRSVGTNANEISISYFPEIGDPNTFVQYRNNYNGFETLRGMFELTYPPGGMVRFPISTMNWSKYLNENPGAISIGGDPSGWNTVDVLQAIEELFSGVAASKAGIYRDRVYLNLRDYVDADDIPMSLDNGIVEAVPMISEVAGRYVVSRQADGSFSVGFQLRTEFAYPFQHNTTTPFDLEITELTISDPGNTSTLPQLVPVVPAGTFPKTLGNAVPMNQKVMYTVVNDPSWYVNSGAADTNTYPSLDANFTVQVKLLVKQAGVNVDAVPYPEGGTPLTFNVRMTNIVFGNFETYGWIENMDPRFNAEPANTQNWLDGSLLKTYFSALPIDQTLGATNNMTDLLFNPAKYGLGPGDFLGIEPDLDKDMQMHVANEQLKSVGELGYLTYDIGRTLRLYKHADYSAGQDPPEYHKMYEKFKVTDVASSRRGLINLNTQDTNTLVAAFADMPLDDYLDTPSETLDVAGARAIADLIVANGPYTNVADLGKIEDWPDYIGSPNGRGINEMKAESFIRNSSGLFGTRQNLFLIITAGRLGTEGGVNRNRSMRRAVALVWRDPEPNSEGLHDSFIRYFQWLAE